jgi:tRNA (Thr-GGU) A37 N-methylase
MRPNRIGASICMLTDVQGTSVAVRGLDAVDASPVLDIKPVWLGYLPRTQVREPEWAAEIMSAYW